MFSTNKIVLTFLVIQGVLMATSINEIKIKDSVVPVVFEKGDYIPIVSIQLVFHNAGYLYSQKDGVSDMSASLLHEGTKKDGSSAFATKLDEHAVDIGAGVGRESFTLEVSSLKSEFSYAVERFKELLKDPNYTEEAFENVKHQKLGWIMHKKSDFNYIAGTKLRELIFKGTPLARHYNGTQKSIDTITLQDTKEYLSKHLGYNNVTVVAGGDIDEKELYKYLKEILTIFPKVDIKPIQPIVASSKKETVEVYEETEQAYIFFASPFNYGWEDKDQYKAQIAEYLLGGAGFGSRLMEELRVKRGLTYGIYASLKRSKIASYMSGYVQTKLSSQDEAKDLIQKVVDEFVKDGITQKELDDTKKFLLGSEPLRTETLSQRVGRAYDNYYYKRDTDFNKQNLKSIENVTLIEINNFIKKHTELLDISFSIVTKKSESNK